MTARDGSPGEVLEPAGLERRHGGGPYTADVRAYAMLRAGAAAQAVMQSMLALGTCDAGLAYHAGAITIARGGVAGGRERQALALNPAFAYTGVPEGPASPAATLDGPRIDTGSA